MHLSGLCNELVQDRSEIDRLTHPDERVARNLGALFHPVLYPGVGSLLRITQQELAERLQHLIDTPDG